MIKSSYNTPLVLYIFYITFAIVIRECRDSPE